MECLSFVMPYMTERAKKRHPESSIQMWAVKEHSIDLQCHESRVFSLIHFDNRCTGLEKCVPYDYVFCSILELHSFAEYFKLLF